jgi:peptidoglycan/xylan/chitin deacetylase (PgdA/CDA1 family)
MSILKRLASIALPGRVLMRGSQGPGRAIALTFDDGPHLENTPALLDAFDRAEVRVTFFLIGQAAERHPALTRRILEAGHQVANHGYSHLNARKVPSARYVADIERGHEALEQVLGTKLERYTRPPYGVLTLASLAGLLRKDHRLVLWSVDSLDYSVDSAQSLLQVVRTHRIVPGDIVLAHDDYAHTVQAMEGILASFDSRRLELKTVSELFS